MVDGYLLKKQIKRYTNEYNPPRQDKKNFKEITAYLDQTSKQAQQLKKPFKQSTIIDKTLIQNPLTKAVPIKKKENRIESFVFYAIIAFTLIIFSSVLTGADKNGTPRNIGGYAPMTVLTKSMQSVYPKDSFLLVKVTDPKSLQVGDDITFMKENHSTITHRIISIEENYQGTGQRGFETKGVENPKADEEIVRADNVIGKVTYSSHTIGKALVLVRKNLWLTAAILIISLFFLDSCVSLLKSLKESQ